MLPTGEQERDEAGFFWHVELEAGAAEDVLHHGLRSAGSLQEGQELLGFLRFLKHKRERGRKVRRLALSNHESSTPVLPLSEYH